MIEKYIISIDETMKAQSASLATLFFPFEIYSQIRVSDFFFSGQPCGSEDLQSCTVHQEPNSFVRSWTRATGSTSINLLHKGIKKS